MIFIFNNTLSDKVFTLEVIISVVLKWPANCLLGTWFQELKAELRNLSIEDIKQNTTDVIGYSLEFNVNNSIFGPCDSYKQQFVQFEHKNSIIFRIT